MRGFLLFVSGLLLGTALQTVAAQALQPGMKLNHVAISVPDIAQALTWYGDKLGLHEVARNTNPQGQVQAVYLQISRDTFIELQQSNPQRPVGINHFGFDMPDIKTGVAAFRQRGLMVSEPGAPSTWTGSILANITDPNVGRIELSEQPPGGQLRKAIDGWK